MSFQYLEMMFHRLSEAKALKARAETEIEKEALEHAAIAIKCSIKDYIKTHGGELK